MRRRDETTGIRRSRAEDRVRIGLHTRRDREARAQDVIELDPDRLREGVGAAFGVTRELADLAEAGVHAKKPPDVMLAPGGGVGSRLKVNTCPPSLSVAVAVKATVWPT